MKKSMHRAIVSLPLKSGVIGVCVLLAQQGAAAATAAASSTVDTGAGMLDEITITAQRREEKLDKVPISVTAFSQKVMDDLHIRSFNDLATIVPGLIVSNPVAGFQDSSDVAIRGIFSGGNAPTTQFYIDETPVAIRSLPAAGPSGSPRPLIFDLERVEVLRGPQGTLFGSSAMGGAIRYITPQPNLHEAGGFSKADFSYTDGGKPNYEVGAAFGSPLVADTAAFRVSGWFQKLGGFIDKEDPFTGQILQRRANSSRSYVVRAAVIWAPAEALSITPAFFIQQISQKDPSTYWLTFLPHPEPNGHVSGALPEPSVDRLRVSSIAVKYDFSGVSFVSDTSYLQRDFVAIDDFTHGAEYILTGQPFVAGVPTSFHSYFNDKSFTHALQQEFRLSSQDPSARINWVAGLYYRRAIQGLTQYIPGSLDPVTLAFNGMTSLQYLGNPNYVIGDQVFNGYTNYETTDVSKAAFGEITLEILPRLKANVGARIDHSIIKDQHQISAGPANGLTYANKFLPDDTQNPITPRAGLTYQYTDTGMVYASAAKGYRAGGGNGATAIGNQLCNASLAALGLTSVPNSFTSDRLWSYELGAKDSLFNRRLAIQASAFYIKWNDIQTGVFLPSCAQAFTANRGKAVSRGFDLQIAAIPVEGLKLGANVGYTNAYYPNANYGAPSVTGVVPLLNAAGDKLVNVLPWTAAANAEFSHDIGALWSGSRAYMRLDYRWLGASNTQNPNVAGFDPLTGPYQDAAYSFLNVRLGAIHDGIDLSLYVENATRKDPRLSYTHDVFGDPMFYATAVRPLTAGITMFYRF
ncbi:MAG: TonB-dependent receptor [Pseudomonadota bacterium]|nr:TonB-dependent receptor [Pseudomonadota bacterium]